MKTIKRCIAAGLALMLAASVTVSAAAWEYKVKSGDSMWKIAKNNGVTLNKLIDANPQVKNPDLIYPNDIIYVPGDEAAEYTDEQARLVLEKTNGYRASAGLSALVLDKELCAVAAAKAQDMAAKGYFSHTSPTYGTPSQMLNAFGVSYGYMGENIAKGYSSAAAVVSGWMSSTGHRANILGASFKKLGVGYSAKGNIWVQIFTD